MQVNIQVRDRKRFTIFLIVIIIILLFLLGNIVAFLFGDDTMVDKNSENTDAYTNTGYNKDDAEKTLEIIPGVKIFPAKYNDQDDGPGAGALNSARDIIKIYTNDGDEERNDDEHYRDNDDDSGGSGGDNTDSGFQVADPGNDNANEISSGGDDGEKTRIVVKKKIKYVDRFNTITDDNSPFFGYTREELEAEYDKLKKSILERYNNLVACTADFEDTDSALKEAFDKDKKDIEDNYDMVVQELEDKVAALNQAKINMKQEQLEEMKDIEENADMPRIEKDEKIRKLEISHVLAWAALLEEQAPLRDKYAKELGDADTDFQRKTEELNDKNTENKAEAQEKYDDCKTKNAIGVTEQERLDQMKNTLN